MSWVQIEYDREYFEKNIVTSDLSIFIDYLVAEYNTKIPPHKG